MQKVENGVFFLVRYMGNPGRRPGKENPFIEKKQYTPFFDRCNDSD